MKFFWHLAQLLTLALTSVSGSTPPPKYPKWVERLPDFGSRGLSGTVQELEQDLYGDPFSVNGLLLHRHHISFDSKQLDDRPETQDTALWTGVNLGALCMQYTQERDPSRRELTLSRIRQRIKGIQDLFEVTGKPGLASRFAFNPQDPSYRDTFLAKRSLPCEDRDDTSWREVPADSPNIKYRGWRYQGNISRDQYSGLIYGIGMCSLLLDLPELRSEFSKRTMGLQCTLDSHGYSPPIEDPAPVCYQNRKSFRERALNIFFEKGYGDPRFARITLNSGLNVEKKVTRNIVGSLSISNPGQASLALDQRRSVASNGQSWKIGGNIGSAKSSKLALELNQYSENSAINYSLSANGTASVQYSALRGKVLVDTLAYTGQGDTGIKVYLRTKGRAHHRPIGDVKGLTLTDLENRDLLIDFVENLGLDSAQLMIIKSQVSRASPEMTYGTLKALMSVTQELADINSSGIGGNGLRGMMRASLSELSAHLANRASDEELRSIPECQSRIGKERGIHGLRRHFRREADAARQDMLANPERFNDLNNIFEYYAWHFRYFSSHLYRWTLFKELDPREYYDHARESNDRDVSKRSDFLKSYFLSDVWRHTFDHQNPVFNWIALGILGKNKMQEIGDLSIPAPSAEQTLGEAKISFFQWLDTDRRNLPNGVTQSESDALGRFEPSELIKEFLSPIANLLVPKFASKLRPELAESPLPVRLRPPTDFLWQRNPRDLPIVGSLPQVAPEDPERQFYPRGYYDGRTQYNVGDSIYAYQLGRLEGAIAEAF